MDYTPEEMMVIATGRELADGELVILGVGLSMLAGYFAQKAHAPDLTCITETGIYGATPVGGLPWGVEDNRISSNATSFTNAIDALGCLVASGRCDVGIIGAAQLDMHGNVNTTGIWGEDVPRRAGRYTVPRRRLNGSGGANDIAVGCKRFIIMAAHEKRRFVEQVDYVSSPGYLGGGGERERYGFPGNGPSAIVTTLGVLRPDPVSKEFCLDARHAFAAEEEIMASTGWPLRVREGATVVPEPTEQELRILREVDATGSLRKR
jgi:glutaconate CoA-transferase, subunit B